MIQLNNVSKAYATGEMALQDISLLVDPGEFVFLVGPSGSGKTTLLRMLIRDTLPTSGSVMVNEMDLISLPKNKLPQLRRNIGVIFQDLKLLSDRTIAENILLPLHISGVDDTEAVKRVDEVLGQVGILDHKEKFPIQLSGGELQRAAIARALVFSPVLLLADEPTGNLDMATSWEIVKLLQEINARGTTILMATHNTDIINNMVKRVIALEKGKLIKDTKKAKKDSTNHSEQAAEEGKTEHHTKGVEKTSHEEEKKEKSTHEKIAEETEIPVDGLTSSHGKKDTSAIATQEKEEK
jgi:cell division transport system ATP-binding protein